MGSKPKIIVLKRREIIYTAIFLALAVTLVILLVIMFTSAPRSSGVTAPSEQLTEDDTQTTPTYAAGVYTTPVTFNDSAVDVEVTVDETHINSIRLVNLSETTATMYPLVSPAFEELADQIISTQSLEHITCPEENKYTSQVLLNAISDALAKARVQ